MAKLLKIVFGVIGVLLLVVVLAVGAFALFFDANAFRGKITEATKKATGRDLVIGDIHVGIYPRLGARVQKLTLGNAAGFGPQPFAAIETADVGLALLPLLLRHEVRIDGVTLSGLSLDLEKHADGSSNWDDLAKQGNEAPKPDDQAPGSFDIKSIDIAGIAIENASIRYTDAQAKKSYTLSKLGLHTGAIQPSRPFDFTLEFSTAISDPAVNANVSLSSRLNLDPARKLAAAEKLALKIKAALPDKKVDLDVDGSINADYGKLVFSSEKLSVKTHAELPDLKADAELASRVGADLNAKLVKLEKITADASAEGKKLPGGKQKVTLSADAIYDGAKGSLKLASADFTAPAVGLNGSLALDGSGLNGNAPRFVGPLIVKPFNARVLLDALGVKLDTADPNTLKEVSLKTRLDATSKSARLGELAIKLDQSTLSGSVDITDLATQAAEFALKLDAIDADRYLAPKPEPSANSPPATPAEKAKADAQPLSFDALDTFTANGTIDVGKLRVSHLNLAGVHLQLAAAKGRDKNIALTANLYEGTIASTTRIAPGARASLAQNLKLTGISAEPLLNDLTGKAKLSGHGNVALDVTGAGRTVGELKRALNGNLSFSFTDGAVKGFNLGQMLRKAEAFTTGQQLSDNAPPQTDFSELSASGTITNGVLQSNDLAAKSPLFRLEGAGKVDLANETIDYVAKPTVVNTATGQGGKELENLHGVMIPIKVGGTFSDPKYSIDLKAALAQKATDKLKGRLSDQIEKKLKGDDPNTQQLKDVLKGFLGGRKSQPAAPAPTPAPAPSPAPAPAPGT